MNVEIRTSKPKAELVPCEIFVDGKLAGDLTPRLCPNGSLSWHACVRLREFFGSSHVCLMQGFGSSHREAIADAIKRARQEAEGMMRQANEFARLIGYSDQASPSGDQGSPRNP